MEYRGTELGFREQIPEGHVLLIRGVDTDIRIEYKIEARVKAEAEPTDKHQAAIDSGELEAYEGRGRNILPLFPSSTVE